MNTRVKNLFAWTLIQGTNATNIMTGVLIAHVLSPFEFGRFATMAASLTMMTAILNPLMNEIAHFIARSGTIHLASLKRRTIAGVIICCGISFFACRPIAFTSLDRLLLFGILPITLIGANWIVAILMGLHRMRVVGGAQLGGALAKLLLLAVVLLYAPTLTPIAWANAATFVVVVGLGVKALGPLRYSDGENWEMHWGILLGFFFLSLPFSLDQVLVQLKFPHLSGDYAAIMTYAKSVMFIASPALTLAYTSAIHKVTNKNEQLQRVKILVLFLIFCAPLAIVFWFAHPFLFPLLLGPQYTNVMTHVGTALLAITLHAVAFSVIQLYVRSARWGFTTLLLAPVLVQSIGFLSLQSPSIARLLQIGVWTFSIQIILALGACFLTTPATGER